MIRLQQLRIPVGHTEDALRRAAAAALGIAVEEIRALRVHRQGVDARHPRQIYFIYSLDLETTDETAVLSGSRPNVAAVAEAPYAFSPRPTSFPIQSAIFLPCAIIFPP
jgi:uncharacterized FAD-dependent dehydrogenase